MRCYNVTLLLCTKCLSDLIDSLMRVFLVQIDYVMGLKYLYRLHVFYYSLYACVGITAIYLIVRGPDRWKRYKVEDAYVV